MATACNRPDGCEKAGSPSHVLANDDVTIAGEKSTADLQPIAR